MLFLVIISSFSIVFVNSQDPEIYCVHQANGQTGRCIAIEKCPSAKRDERFNITPQACSTNSPSDSDTKNICCLGDVSKERNEWLEILGFIDDECCRSRKPLQPLKQGNKAWEMCLKYQRSRWKRCLRRYGSSSLGTGGANAEEKEFLHMALLAYGKFFSEAEFICGGSLISERFVLTAGHCTSYAGVGNVTFAVFGILSTQERPLKKNVYGVKNIIKHPMYKPPIKYHDIALLEMDRLVRFSDLVVPACLHVGDPVDDTRAYATGWGILGRSRKRATILQTVPLWKVSKEYCRLKFAPYKRHLPDGIDDASQMCYGDDGTPRDTCEGDSGGPLQIESNDIYCMYIILGVTSFGITACGEVGYPGVYTRVSNYVPWIESIVWP